MDTRSRLRRALIATVCAAAAGAGTWGAPLALPTAAAYEFEVRARTFGQGYSLRSFRLLGPSLQLSRRRITQTLSLDLFDIGDLRGPRLGRALYERPYAGGPHVYFSMYLRLDHDDGDWATGSQSYAGQRFDAVDLVPELEDDLLALDILYGYLAADGLLDGRLDLSAGRHMMIGGFDAWSFDGARARVHALRGPAELALELFGGLRVREASLLASATTEPDGTGGAACAEYVEGPVPGSGAWRPIDRSQRGARGFANDYDLCPQREARMPTFGAAVQGRFEAGEGAALWGRAEYRRALSQRPELIGAVDRFPEPDLGYYPNEDGQTPLWGVNEERVSASLSAVFDFAAPGAGEPARGQVVPQLGVVHELALGRTSDAHAGVRVRYGSHAIEPEVYYRAPIFDADSIFNVFATEPYTDLRLTYELQPERWPARGYVRGWARRYRPADDDEREAASGEYDDWAGGAQLGLGYRPRSEIETRLDLFHEDGYGGRRSGGFGGLGWQLARNTGVRGRVGLVSLDERTPDARTNEVFTLRDVHLALQAGASHRINAGVLVHVLLEHDLSRYDRDQVRLMALLDLAFLPELP
ncbi:hypothetical protein [Haliangium ochraceum]|uniref:Uncharacterized protein n=1 Tax=Haliangium ochraceum (strain DSM 14365 / JCM 11303 / SMP-2) TaxID=502025 RepID=D0LX37_HALO1|nr:hypothetical protein [Haliangium ochraceum]ACY16079.1 hypothetical protein Hoch_3577 [Haliangium ochraceum DSM 14365]